jgi:agmatine deiminase
MFLNWLQAETRCSSGACHKLDATTCYINGTFSMEIHSDYRLPAEFERHKATWLLWPSRPDNWRCNAYFGQSDIAALAATIAHFEPVRLGVPPELEKSVRAQVPPAVRVVPMRFNDIWVRDTGPTTLVSNSRPSIAVDWQFNSWGGLFSEAMDDDRVAAEIAHYEQLQTIRAPMVLEGGAIISDGQGTIITTEESVLATNRNPGLSFSDAEDIFKHFLRANTVIWLPYGLDHDEAGGHVDNVCAFASTRVILLAWTDDRTHPNHDRVRLAKDRLTRSTNASGQSFSVIEVPLPEPTKITSEEAAGFQKPEGSIVRKADTILAPSHINFYATEKAVFVPTFNSSSDNIAVEIIRAAFPGRLIIPYRSRDFLLGGGAIHCLTKEIPA